MAASDPRADPFGADLPPSLRSVRTTRRRSRMSAAKAATLRDALPRWAVGLWPAWDAEALEGAFGRVAPRWLDIGVGDGAATRTWAAAHPDVDVVALELHRPGIAKLVDALDAEGPPNVRIAEADAVEVLATVPAGSLGAVRILFPDPWPKRRHLERRLVDRTFVARIADALEPGGRVEVATDWDDYAAQVREALEADLRLELVAPIWARPVTAYERRGLDAGRAITDLAAVKRRP